MVEDHEVSTQGIDDRGACLATHEERAQVVPDPVGIRRAVHEAVERALGHGTEVQGDRSHGPELTPTQVPGRQAGEPDERIPQRFTRRGGRRAASHDDAAPAHRLVGAPTDQVPDQRGARAFAIDCTETGGEPRQVSGGVRGAVEGVDHDHHLGVEAPLAGLLAQHAHPRGAEDRMDRGVRDEITAVLTHPFARGAPVGQGAERCSHRVGRPSQQRHQLIVAHGRSHVRNVAPPWQARDVAAIDVAGFIADLKDHAVDHGFHVHDERHFVESYSLRQAWEVDLHPEEACGGPLDLHLSLEVDPRVLLSFEDKVLELPETDEPPDEFHFPMLFTWALPPLPMGPDLLVLATELAGVGGPDLPLEVSAIDSFAAVTDAPERSLAIVARIEVSLAKVFLGQELLCEVLDRCLAVSQYLLDRAPVWLDEV